MATTCLESIVETLTFLVALLSEKCEDLWSAPCLGTVPLSVTFAETQTLVIGFPRELGGDRTDVAFGESVSRVTLCFFNCRWLAKGWQPEDSTVLCFRKKARCSQRLALCSHPLKPSQGHGVNLLLRWELWKNGHIVPGIPQGLGTSGKGWPAVCR